MDDIDKGQGATRNGADQVTEVVSDDGSPHGIVTADVGNWNGKILAAGADIVAFDATDRYETGALPERRMRRTLPPRIAAAILMVSLTANFSLLIFASEHSIYVLARWGEHAS